MTPEEHLKARLVDTADRIKQLEEMARTIGDADGSIAAAIIRKKAAQKEIGDELKKLAPKEK